MQHSSVNRATTGRRVEQTRNPKSTPIEMILSSMGALLIASNFDDTQVISYRLSDILW